MGSCPAGERAPDAFYFSSLSQNPILVPELMPLIVWLILQMASPLVGGGEGERSISYIMCDKCHESAALRLWGQKNSIIYLTVHLSVYPFVLLYIPLSSIIYLSSIFLSSLPIHTPICLSSIYIYISMSISLSIHRNRESHSEPLGRPLITTDWFTSQSLRLRGNRWCRCPVWHLSQCCFGHVDLLASPNAGCDRSVNIQPQR